MLSLAFVETVDDKEGIILVLTLSSVSHLGEPCLVLPRPPAHTHTHISNSPMILLFGKWMLVMANQYWQIRNGI